MYRMNTWKMILVLMAAMALIAGCGAAPTAPTAPATVATPATAAAPAGTLVDTYDDALSVRNQLAYGTLRLEGTAQAVTSGQAETLLPLWQALQALGASTTAATEETAAVQTQIQSTLSPDQVSAISAMRLTNAMLQTYYVEIGVAEVRTPEPGVTPQSSSLRDLPPEEREAARATAQALGTPVGSGSGGSGSGSEKRDALLDEVLELLSARAQGK